MRLLVQQGIHACICLMRRRHGIRVLGELVLRRREFVHKRRAIPRQIADELALMRLRAPRQHGGDEGDADAAAEIAHEIVEAASVADLRLSELAHGGRGEWHKNKADGDAVDEAGPDDIHRGDL